MLLVPYSPGSRAPDRVSLTLQFHRPLPESRPGLNSIVLDCRVVCQPSIRLLLGDWASSSLLPLATYSDPAGLPK